MQPVPPGLAGEPPPTAITLLLLSLGQFFIDASAAPPSGVGMRVATNATVNVRASAGKRGLLGRHTMGRSGTTVGGPVRADLGGTRYTWFYVDFDTGVDGWVADIGLDRVALPTISFVTPNPVSGSSSRQSFAIYGSSFEPGAVVRLKDLSNGGTFDKTPTYSSSTRLVIRANFTTAQATWSAQVFNAGNVGSNVRKFLVDAPPMRLGAPPDGGDGVR